MPLMYSSSRAFNYICSLPIPSSRVLLMCIFTILLGERSVVKNRVLKRFSFIRVHIACRRQILCGCRLRLTLWNGDEVLYMELQIDAKLLLVFQKVSLVFAIKT